MTTSFDYLCAIVSFAVLTTLSALSHFWYVMIAICAVAVLTAVAFRFFVFLIRAKREMLAWFLSPAVRKNARSTKASADFARRPNPSLPVA